MLQRQSVNSSRRKNTEQREARVNGLANAGVVTQGEEEHS